MLLAAPVFAASPASELLTQRLASLLPRDARWGLAVMDLAGSKELLGAGSPTIPLVPASLVKLFVSGAALEAATAGKSPLFDSGIYVSGRLEGKQMSGDLYLQGNGNCFLSLDDLQQVVQGLQKRGIREVAGRVIADGSRFDLHGLECSRKGAAYALPGALGLDLHTVALSITPSGGNKPSHVMVAPLNDTVRVAVSANSTESGRVTLEVVQSSDSTYQVSGKLPLSAGLQRRRFALENPTLYTGQSLSSLLKLAGITMAGEAIEGKTPQDAHLLARIPGPDLLRYLTEMNRYSLNVAADNLLLALGGTMYGYPATKEKGLLVINKHLHQAGLAVREAVVVDGSGLQTQNRLTAQAMVRYLVWATQQPWFSVLDASLPRPGQEGTLRAMTFTDQRFRVKTGRLEQASSLAGYGVDRQGRRIAFAFLVNSDKPLPPLTVRIWDEIMHLLAHEVLQ